MYPMPSPTGKPPRSAESGSIPLGTVKTRTRAALTRLADLLEHEELR
jgi:hypothetical protein